MKTLTIQRKTFKIIFTEPNHASTWQRLIGVDKQIIELGDNKENPNITISLDNGDGFLTEFLVQIMGANFILHDDDAIVFKGIVSEIKGGRVISIVAEAGYHAE